MAGIYQACLLRAYCVPMAREAQVRQVPKPLSKLRKEPQSIWFERSKLRGKVHLGLICSPVDIWRCSNPAVRLL